MTDSPCPCRYDPELGAIVFCNLHSAAGELLEACKRGRRKLATYTAIYSGDTELVKLLAMWDAAIQKAEKL